MTTVPGASPIRIARVIARLNIGGPAIQAITLTRALRSRGFQTTLIRGREGPAEGNMDALADALEVTPMLLDSMRRDPGGPDLWALWSLILLLRRARPAVVHTHAAKAGTLGRVATVLAFPLPGSRPALVHTYHGHSLDGYFSSRTSRAYAAIERLLGRVTDVLIAVSDQVALELAGFKVAPVERFTVVPLGLDLRAFTVDPDERGERRSALRAQLGVADDMRLVTLVARLVAIKRVDRFLAIAQRLAATDSGLRFLIVGDGELGPSLRDSAAARALGDDRLTWTGFRDDIADICFASDVVVLTSDSEGTPVSLIEAQAAGTPVVCTRVGGAASVVRDGVTGFVVDRDDEAGFAASVTRALDDAAVAGAARDGAAAVAVKYSLQRLTDDLERIYREIVP
ncbi:MAG: glycosyltransferase [Solirubrobacteraceae bacterium]